MIIHLDAKVGQTPEEFACDLSWIAARLDCTIFGKFDNGIEIVATSGDSPALLMRYYKHKMGIA